MGSSNLSRTALITGVELNYRVIPASDRRGFGDVERTFEKLFHDPHTRPLDSAWIANYERRWPKRVDRPSPEVPDEPTLPPPEPHTIQNEALSALEATRQEGNRAGLVVMATGLGKTWLAAFDVARLRSRRVLFVAHREEILRQALATFRRILPTERLGLYIGGERDAEADVLFASIQSLGRRGNLERFAPSAFDYIVVDEFHHAAARTYRRLIDHFRPAFLLGLTATPDRTDGGSLLGLCGENLVYRCDLFEAIRRAPERLVPFRYFGVPDMVDYANIPWRNRRFDPDQLEQAVATATRADNALEQWRKHKGGGSRTLGFCCSMAHADFMARHFEAAGVRAVAVHSGPTSAPRATSLDRLASGELEVVFAVDILNEGVDIPDVDTILMLRPTESRIVFLQQLGRGLRAAPNKDRLTVVDYIGNHRSFKLKPQVLLQLAIGDAELRQALSFLVQDPSKLDLPPGCEVTYELEAIRLLEEQLAAPNAADSLTRWYRDFEERTGVRPLALEAFHEGRNPRSARTSHGSWVRFVAAHEGLADEVAALVASGDLASAFLEEIERARMSRSFKMVLLLAMLRADGFPRPIQVDDLVKSFRDLVERSGRLRAEVLPDLDDEKALRAYLITNPIDAWCRTQGGGRTYFAFDKGELRPLFGVPVAISQEYAAVARELAEWRLADYLGGRSTTLESGWRIVCKVTQTRGRPILKLPDRARFENIPEGDVPVQADGRELLAVFRKEYVNVLRGSEEANELAGLMQKWFGDQAGQPGTMFFVAFTNEEDRWSLAPCAPGEFSRALVERATDRLPVSRVLAPDGQEIDASYHLEATDGELGLVFHARGGTGGTAAAVNTEYGKGLEILLERLAHAAAVVEAIYLHTTRTQDSSLEERRLTLRGEREYPLYLGSETDVPDLRRAISAAQGNNPTRRIRVVLRLPGDPDPAQVASLLQSVPE